MILPFDRRALAERNVRDDADEVESSRAMSADESLERTLELCDFVRALSEATGSAGLVSPEPLEEKARRYVFPLHVAKR